MRDAILLGGPSGVVDPVVTLGAAPHVARALGTTVDASGTVAEHGRTARGGMGARPAGRLRRAVRGPDGPRALRSRLRCGGAYTPGREA